MEGQGSNNKRIAKNTLLLYCRQLIALGLSLYTSRLVLDILGETDFGIYAAVGGITSMISVIITSMSASTQRFMSFEIGRNNKERLNKIFSTSNQIHVLLSVIVLFLAETIGLWFVGNYLKVDSTRLNIAIWVFQITIVNTILSILTVPYYALIISYERMGAYALFSIGDVVFKLLGVIAIPFIAIDHLIAYALVMCIVQLLSRIVMWWFCRRSFRDVRYVHAYDKQAFKEMFGLAGWNVINSIAATCYIQGSILSLNYFFGPLINAAYGVAMQAYSGLRQFCSSFQAASSPQLVKSYASDNIAEMHSLLRTVCKVSFFLIFVITFPFLIIAEQVLGFWLVKVPDYAPVFFRLMILYAYFDIFNYPMDISAQATGNIAKYSVVTSAFSFLIIPIAVFLFYIGLPPESVMYVAIISIALSGIMRVKFLTSMIGIRFWMWIKSVYVRCIVCALIGSIFPLFMSEWFNGLRLYLPLIVVVSLISTSLSIWFVGFEINERKKLREIVNKKLGKYRN